MILNWHYDCLTSECRKCVLFLVPGALQLVRLCLIQKIVRLHQARSRWLSPTVQQHLQKKLTAIEVAMLPKCCDQRHKTRPENMKNQWLNHLKSCLLTKNKRIVQINNFAMNFIERKILPNKQTNYRDATICATWNAFSSSNQVWIWIAHYWTNFTGPCIAIATCKCWHNSYSKPAWSILCWKIDWTFTGTTVQ